MQQNMHLLFVLLYRHLYGMHWLGKRKYNFKLMTYGQCVHTAYAAGLE